MTVNDKMTMNRRVGASHFWRSPDQTRRMPVLWKGPECRSWALDRRRGAVDELILAERGCGSHCGGGV